MILKVIHVHQFVEGTSSGDRLFFELIFWVVIFRIRSFGAFQRMRKLACRGYR